MERVINRVVPLLGASDNLIHRQGAIEAIACILHQSVVLSLNDDHTLTSDCITASAVIINYCVILLLFVIICYCISS